MASHGVRGRSGGRPTLEEVAARAGVGRGTVSRVINGSPRVSDATRAAVEAAVAELGYVPNTAARALAANRTDAIALVVPEPETRFFAEPYFSDMLKGVGSELSDTEMQLLLIFAGSDRERERLAQYLAAHRVDGVLLVSVHADDPLPDLLTQLEIPAVISGPARPRSRWPRWTRTTTAVPARPSSTCCPGARPRRPHHRPPRRLRRPATRRRLPRRPARGGPRGGRGPDRAGRLHRGGRAPRDGRAAAPPADVDAVFAASDVTAAGAGQVLREAGRRIPDDVALVGYDDSAIARHMEPPLTSVRQPIEEMGRAMIDLLLTEIADRRPAASRGLERHQVVLATELVERRSS